MNFRTGGNWGQEGKLEFGLQKLVPNGTTTFDVQKMELVGGDFKLTYTKPLSDATLTNLALSPTSVTGVSVRVLRGRSVRYGG